MKIFELLEDRIDMTQSPEFKRWFGNSKVVDDSGKPLVVYHGTNKNFNKFDPKRSIFSDGSIFFSNNSGTANQYAMDSSGKIRIGSNIMPVYLSIKNPLIVDFKGEEDIDGLMDIREQALLQGFDGIIAMNVDDGYGVATQYVTFHSEQIKSAIGNNGKFDPNNPDITKEELI